MNFDILKLRPLGIVLVVISQLTFVLVYSGIMKHGIIIALGLNIAMLLVFVQILAMLKGLKRSAFDSYFVRLHPLYDPDRTLEK